MSVAVNPRLLGLGALDPQTILVDERTLQQRLSFAARYSELIVFFDRNNQASGNWRSFLLKDPLILTALISETPYTPKHRLFLLLCDRMSALGVDSWQLNQLSSNQQTTQRVDLLTQLLSLICGLFSEIDDWLCQMSIGHKNYALRSFVEQQVKNQLSLQLLEYVELHKQVSLACPQVPSPNYEKLQKFNPLWRQGDPGLVKQIKDDDNVLLLAKQIYHHVFGFYVQVIGSAKTSFEQLWQSIEQNQNSYADTALLVSFCRLMEVQKANLNRLTQAHLNFYYRDILQQTPKQATPDSCVVCMTLKPGAIPLLIDKGTLFNAGVNAEQQAQQFAAAKAQWISQVKIEQLQSLRYIKQVNNNAQFKSGQLYLNDINKPDKVEKRPDGDLRNWPLLGCDSGKSLTQGLSLASPLLSLCGGTRTITVKINWVSGHSLTKSQLENAQYYLSTKRKWLQVMPTFDVSDANAASVIIVLQPNDPVIENFAKAEDGYLSQWPLFKWLLAESVDLTEVPRMTSIDLSVNVEGLTTLALYNDDGPLSSDAAFLPFGAMPLKGSSWYVGSNEAFAKPLSSLSVSVDWSHLPLSMQSYYQTYNQYLDHQFDTLGNTDITVKNSPFCNCGFAGAFALYYQGQFNGVKVTTGLPSTTESKENATVEQAAKKTPPKTHLFNQNDSKQLLGSSLFQFDSTDLAKATGEPELLLSPLVFDQEQKSGFIQLQLAAPTQGFGHSVYPKAVAAVTQFNAFRLIDTIKNHRQDTDEEETPPDDTPPTNGEEDDNEHHEDISSIFSSIFGKKQSDKDDKAKNIEKDVVKAADIADKVIDVVDPELAPLANEGNKLLDEALSIKAKGEQNKNTLIAMPNLPLALKVSTVSVTYDADKSLKFDQACDYPFELYHYDSFSNYLVFSTQSQSTFAQYPGLNTKHNEMNIAPGVGTGGCLYLGLDNIEPPANLSVYFYLSRLVAINSDTDIKPLNYYYLSLSGWQKLSVLSDQTKQLQCSGIIEFLLPGDMSQDPTQMPFAQPSNAKTGMRGWLAIQGAGDIAQYADVAYLNTQAVQVTRVMQQPWTSNEVPNLPATTISALSTANSEVKNVVQPFASTSGQASETEDRFLQRVSQRIGNKDRVSVSDDLIQLTYDGLPSLYYCNVVDSNNGGKSNVSLFLVKGYEQQSISAFLPVVNGCEIKALGNYLANRVSPMVQLTLINPAYVEVAIDADLAFKPNVPVQSLCQEIAAQLRLYLSPWITSDVAPRVIGEPLTYGDLVDFFSRWQQVEQVVTLTITVDGEECKGFYEQGLTVNDTQLLVSSLTQNVNQAEVK